MSDRLTFSDVVDFLADHEGSEVYVEIGMPDRDSAEQPADAFLLKAHDYRLGKVEDAGDYNPGGKRKAVMVRLYTRDADPSNEEDRVGSRLFINPRQVTRIEGDARQAVRVWLDDGVYLAISG
jgi:hypothetical protein